MATVETIYVGGLRTQATHLKSGTSIITDAPPADNGRGETFSPTDLLVTALGSCMLTIMGIAAEKRGFNIDNTTLSITKTMNVKPYRVGEIAIDITFPHNNFSDKEKAILKAATKECPVAQSIHPDVKQTINMFFKED